MSPLPAEELTDISNKLVALISSGNSNEFQLKGFEARAHDLMSHSPALAHDILAIIHSSRHEWDDAIDHHKIACSLERSATFLMNFGITLESHSSFKDAIVKIKQAEKVDPNRVDIKRFLVETMYRGALFRVAKAQIEEYDRKGQLKQMQPIKIDFEFLELAADYLISHEISDDALYDMASLAWKLTTDFREQTVGGYIDPDTLYLEYGLDATPEKIAELNTELAYQVAGTDLDPRTVSSASICFSINQ